MPVDGEEWRPVVGFPDYEVSDHGRVRSIDRLVPHAYGGWARLKGKLLAISYATSGYGTVVLRLNNATSHTRYVHDLVLHAFIGPRPTPSHDGAHWDGVRRNNMLTNLRWASKSENNKDTVRYGRLDKEHFRQMGLKGGQASLMSKNTLERRAALMSEVAKKWWASLSAEDRAAAIEKRRPRNKRAEPC